MLLLENNMAEAKLLLEDCIKGHHTGQPLDMKVRKTFHVLLWQQAAVAFEVRFAASQINILHLVLMHSLSDLKTTHIHVFAPVFYSVSLPLLCKKLLRSSS